MDPRVSTLDAGGIGRHAPALGLMLFECVAAGAAIGFMGTLSVAEAEVFWTRDVAGWVEARDRVLFVAVRDEVLLGTVQLIVAMPPNQPHRCEIAKMMVAPGARRQGVGRALLVHALEHARGLGRRLVTLDTRTGDVAEPLYRSAGFEAAGAIPDYAFDADGRGMHATTLMFRRL